MSVITESAGLDSLNFDNRFVARLPADPITLN